MKIHLIPAILVIFLVLIGCKKDKDTAPSITLLGKNPVETAYGVPYSDAGAKASDKEDGDISNKIIVTGSVDTGKTGEYQLKFNVTDSKGHKAPEVIRTVVVKYF